MEAASSPGGAGDQHCRMGPCVARHLHLTTVCEGSELQNSNTLSSSPFEVILPKTCDSEKDYIYLTAT